MKPYLLLVEDDDATAYLALRALQKCGFANDIVRYVDGAETIAHFTTFDHLPTLILLDMKLPKVSGVEVLKYLRSNPKTQQIPVIIQTASNLQGDRNDVSDLGIKGYMVKPMDFSELVDNMTDVSRIFSAAVAAGAST